MPPKKKRYPRNGPKAPCRARIIPALSDDLVSAFWQKVEVGTPEACWPWLGARRTRGYGLFRVGSDIYSTHRIAYSLAIGAIPEGEGYHGTVVMHTCDNPPCCNPSHLRLGTHRDNVVDMIEKGRGSPVTLPVSERPEGAYVAPRNPRKYKPKTRLAIEAAPIIPEQKPKPLRLRWRTPVYKYVLPPLPHRGSLGPERI